MSKCLTHLETELEKREQIFKKYKRTHNLLMKTNAISGTLSVLISGSAVGTSLTVVLIPVGVSLASIGFLFGFVSVLTGLIAKKISLKLNKHHQTVSVCNAKLNTIKDLISKALQDNEISPEEFRLILSEVEKYKKLKKLISSFKKTSKYEKPEKTSSFRNNEVFKSGRNVKLDFNCFFSCCLLIRPKTNDEVSSLEYERPPPYNLNI